MIPAERRQLHQETVGDCFTLGTQGVDGAGQVRRVPQGDGGEYDVETASAVLVRFPAPILQLPAAMEKDGPGKAVARLTLVQFVMGAATQGGIFQPVQGEKCAFQAPEVAQRLCQAVLARVLAGEVGVEANASSQYRRSTPSSVTT